MRLSMASEPAAMEPDSRRVLLVVEDDALAELLDELLTDAGHDAARVVDGGDLEAAAAARPFDAIIVDLDVRARNGATLVERLRHCSPASTIVALLPCGGLPSGAGPVACHLAIEKPARVAALLSAVHVSHIAR
jgi:CheY-like chemotaxis protein